VCCLDVEYGARGLVQQASKVALDDLAAQWRIGAVQEPLLLIDRGYRNRNPVNISINLYK